MTTQLSKNRPEKRLRKRIQKRSGRAKSGRITVRHRGGGARRLYRLVDFKQGKIDVPAKVIAFEYDPYRTANIALLEYKDGEKRYTLAPHELKIGDEVMISEKAKIQVGNRMRLENIPIGTEIFNIELIPNQGGKIVRSAGTSALILAHEGKYTHLKMPSKELRKVNKKGFASIGRVSKPEHRFKKWKKAGDTRHRGRRPQVRGTVMSPRAHPHGGGEGKAPVGMPHPKTPWGKIARGGKTRRRKSTAKYIIKRREK